MTTTAEQLAEIPELAHDMLASWGTRTGGESGGRRRVVGSPSLADLDRMVATDRLRGVLLGWVRVIRDEHDEAGDEVPDWPADHVCAACEWLAAPLPWCDGRGWDIEMRDDIAALWSELRHITGVRDDYRPTCEKCGCRVHLEPGVGRCPDCGWIKLTSPELEKLAAANHATLADAAELLDLNLNLWTLRDWAKRGVIKPVGRSGNAGTYDLDDIRRAAERVATHHATSRPPSAGAKV